jgi:hypothetical protein
MTLKVMMLKIKLRYIMIFCQHTLSSYCHFLMLSQLSNGRVFCVKTCMQTVPDIVVRHIKLKCC